jgi:DNA-binding NarL/FixJ family response regulator
MKKILLVDDHDIIIDGLIAMLQDNTDYQIIGKANDGNEAIQNTETLNPDIIIMDISMPNLSGIDATKIIKSKYHNIKIIVLTQHDKSEYVLEILKAGADGYLLKNSKKDELLEALKTVEKDQKYLGHKISDLMINNYLSNQNTESEKETLVQLTKREIEIIRLISSDLSNQEIADELNISLRTVETHRRNLMQKLNVKTVVALVHYAIKNNIISVK